MLVGLTHLELGQIGDNDAGIAALTALVRGLVRQQSLVPALASLTSLCHLAISQRYPSCRV
jgi:hypothetical protein